jgi:tetratricopeptide (TPR) repeat protein
LRSLSAQQFASHSLPTRIARETPQELRETRRRSIRASLPLAAARKHSSSQEATFLAQREPRFGLCAREMSLGMFLLATSHLGHSFPSIPTWSHGPEAQAAAAAVAGELAEVTQPLHGCLEELVRAPRLSLRRVWASPGFVHAPGCALTALPSCCAGIGMSCAILMTHVFELPAASGSQQIRLITAQFALEAGMQELLAAVYGPDAHIALPSETEMVYTDVWGDHGRLDAAALATMPKQARAALRVALRVQRLAALAASIEARWATGFLTINTTAIALWPRVAVPLNALQTTLITNCSAGEINRVSIIGRQLEGEALETQGRYMEAAALYKQNLADDSRNPALRLVATPPQQWSFYGLALKRAGRYAEAHRAYEAGLRALSSGRPIFPDTPEWRETQRLDLLGKCITLALAWSNVPLFEASYERIFVRQRELLEAAGDTAPFLYDGMNDDIGAVLIGRQTGRRFAVVTRLAGVADGLNKGLRLMRIDEMDRNTDINASISEESNHKPLTASERDAQDRENARTVTADHGAAAAPARLPPKCCALCGKLAYGRCGGCCGPAYCDATCQKAHWKAHKAECKAACKAAAS